MKPAELEKLKEKLTNAFASAHVNARHIGSKRAGRYRLAVVSPDFRKMPHLKRQDKVWEVVDQAVAQKDLPQETLMDVSLILAYAPDEVEQPA